MDVVPMDCASSSATPPPATDNAPSYAVSRIIQAHASDAKALAITHSGAIISGGRDDKIKFWNKKGGEYSATLTLDQPKGIAVNSLAYAETNDGWRIFAGRKDGSIAMFGSGSSEPINVFREHQNNVCCLHINEKLGVLLSGSWDSNVFVWPINEIGNPSFSPSQALQLHGHSLSVWALATFDNMPNVYLSASADKTIRLWENGETVHIFQGHTDVVRALAVLTNNNFLSAGNDGHILQWDISQRQCIGKFKTNAHDFIYSMTLSDSHVLTTGEEGTLEFWRFDNDNEGNSLISSEIVLQTPSASTWDCKVLPSTDIAVATSDGRIFIYSKDPARHATAEIREAFDAEVVAKIATKINREKTTDVVTIKVALDDGPAKLELNYKKGSDPTIAAETFIRNNNLPMSYLNEVVDYICQNIPEAQAARFGTQKLQPGQRKNVDGVMYDHVFEVGTDDGRELQMGYNRGDDPDWTAQKFVEKHNLPIKFFGSLAQLIRNEISGMTNNASSGGGGAGYEDPYFGSGRYVPGGNSANTGNYSDPFSGEGRYVPGSGNGGNGGGFGGDPLTGDGGYRPSDNNRGYAVPLSSMEKDKKKPRGPLVPVPEFYTFGTQGLSLKVVARLKEMNDKQEAFRLNADQISALEELIVVSQGANFTSDTVTSAFEMALQWPVEDVLPILDFLRVGLLHKSINSYFCGAQRGSDFIMKMVAILISDPAEPTRVFACRCICNAYAHPEGRKLLCSAEVNLLAPLLIKQLQNSNTFLQMAAATALADWSLALFQESTECAQLGPREDILRHLITSFEIIPSFGGISEEALIRILQAIVTLMWGDSNIIKTAKNRDMAGIATRMKDAIVSDNGKNIARDIVEMTYAV